jgi:hypothetical protein
MWDNLVYQNEGLTIFRRWIEGDGRATWENISQSRNPLYASALAFSYLIFGMDAGSPYVISALFGFGFISALYLLALQLGASRGVAFLGAMLWSINPNFLYQNFLQTRNDYPLACFFGFSWLFFLKAAETKRKNKEIDQYEKNKKRIERDRKRDEAVNKIIEEKQVKQPPPEAKIKEEPTPEPEPKKEEPKPEPKKEEPEKKKLKNHNDQYQKLKLHHHHQSKL